MLWITNKGVDYLTHIIDKYTGTSKWSKAMSRDLDILGILEERGGGYTPGQLVNILASRDIEHPLIGTDEQYLQSLKRLVRRGFVTDLEGGK